MNRSRWTRTQTARAVAASQAALDTPPKDLDDAVRLYFKAIRALVIPEVKRFARHARRSRPGKWQYRRTRS